MPQSRQQGKTGPPAHREATTARPTFGAGHAKKSARPTPSCSAGGTRGIKLPCRARSRNTPPQLHRPSSRLYAGALKCVYRQMRSAGRFAEMVRPPRSHVRLQSRLQRRPCHGASTPRAGGSPAAEFLRSSKGNGTASEHYLKSLPKRGPVGSTRPDRQEGEWPGLSLPCRAFNC